MWLRIFYQLGKYLSAVKDNKREFIHHFSSCLQMAIQHQNKEVASLCQIELDKLNASIMDLSH
jgi:hypothetical protein